MVKHRQYLLTHKIQLSRYLEVQGKCNIYRRKKHFKKKKQKKIYT